MFNGGALLILLCLATTLLADTPLYAGDTCGGSPLFSAIVFNGACYDVPAQGTCEDIDYCAGRADFASSTLDFATRNCTVFDGSFRFSVSGTYTTFTGTNCTGTETTTTPTTLCRPFYFCGAESIDLSAFFDGESSSSPSSSSSDSSSTSAALSWIGM